MNLSISIKRTPIYTANRLITPKNRRVTSYDWSSITYIYQKVYHIFVILHDNYRLFTGSYVLSVDSDRVLSHWTGVVCVV
jgi:hypothetical protein